MTATQSINNYKERLIRKAQKIGLWENFGCPEIKVLKDSFWKHEWVKKVGGGLGDDVWQAILDFENWCANIDDVRLRKL